jgi:transposase
MSCFAGLDVSLHETSVCIVDNDGKVIRESKVETAPAALQSALSEHAKELGRVGVEASSIGIWVQRELHAVGLPIIVVETRHMRNALSAMRNKTDRNDARGIAQMVRLGWFRPVHVKSLENQKLRTLLANRKLLKRKLIDLENHIRGAIRTYGLRVGHVSRKTFDARVRELLGSADAVFEVMISTMLAVRQTVLESFTAFC